MWPDLRRSTAPHVKIIPRREKKLQCRRALSGLNMHRPTDSRVLNSPDALYIGERALKAKSRLYYADSLLDPASTSIPSLILVHVDRVWTCDGN